jgi:YgiT-type zinc finger domain-containing protein
MTAGQEELSTCTRCDGSALRATTVHSAFWEDDRLIVVEDIPALVCPKCHEQYFDDETVVLLDLMRGDGYPPESALREITVPVFSLRNRSKPEAES